MFYLFQAALLQLAAVRFLRCSYIYIYMYLVSFVFIGEKVVEMHHPAVGDP